MSFNTSLSGLNAALTDLSVTGNNIANASTHGFKESRTEFADVYALSYGGMSGMVAGKGVRVAAIAQQHSQGNVEFTNNNLDLAISGQGFFVMKDTDGSEIYSRQGAFRVDRDGYVVNAHGQRLQAMDVDANGNGLGNQKDLLLDLKDIGASATTGVDIVANLDASITEMPYAAPNTLAIDPTNPNSYHFSTTSMVYDSQGETHQATMYFRKLDDATNTWEAGLEFDNGGVLVGTNETLQFDTKGVLTSAMPVDFGTGGGGVLTVSGADDILLDVDFTGTSQFAGDNAVNSLNQDGWGNGRVSGVDVDQRGVVFARYTNGQSKTLGAVQMMNVANPQGLRPLGDTNWAASYEAGEVTYGQAATGTLGGIQSSALEASNVELTEQLVRMITAQRNFQANSQMLSTEDQVTQTMLNIR